MQTRSSPSRNTLHRLAEQAAIPEYQKMSKKILFEKLKQQFDLNRLQRAEQRRHKNTKRSRGEDGEDEFEEREMDDIRTSKSTPTSTTTPSPSTSTRLPKKIRPSRKLKCDNFDPIMRTPLGKNIFTFVRPNGSFTRFNVESLVDYMLETGDFTDPASRLSFSDDDLKMIDSLSSEAKLNKDSVYNAKKNNTQIYADKHFRRDALQGLERCAGEIVSEMLQLIEASDPEEAQMKLLMTEFPAFADLYQQIKDVDPVFAKQCNRSWLLYLQGPPNRPTKNTYGLLQIILHFVKGCDNLDQIGLLDLACANELEHDFEDDIEIPHLDHHE